MERSWPKSPGIDTNGQFPHHFNQPFPSPAASSHFGGNSADEYGWDDIDDLGSLTSRPTTRNNSVAVPLPSPGFYSKQEISIGFVAEPLSATSSCPATPMPLLPPTPVAFPSTPSSASGRHHHHDDHHHHAATQTLGMDDDRYAENRGRKMMGLAGSRAAIAAATSTTSTKARQASDWLSATLSTHYQKTKTRIKPNTNSTTSPSPHPGGAGSSTNNGHPKIQWRPGLLHQLPHVLPALFALLLSLLSAILCIVVVATSDGVPVDSYSSAGLRPSVLLALLAVLANAGLGFAHAEGHRVAWWRRAIGDGGRGGGETARELEGNWVVGSGVRGAVGGMGVGGWAVRGVRDAAAAAAAASKRESDGSAARRRRTTKRAGQWAQEKMDRVVRSGRQHHNYWDDEKKLRIYDHDDTHEDGDDYYGENGREGGRGRRRNAGGGSLRIAFATLAAALVVLDGILLQAATYTELRTVATVSEDGGRSVIDITLPADASFAVLQDELAVLSATWGADSSDTTETEEADALSSLLATRQTNSDGGDGDADNSNNNGGQENNNKQNKNKGDNDNGQTRENNEDGSSASQTHTRTTETATATSSAARSATTTSSTTITSLPSSSPTSTSTSTSAAPGTTTTSSASSTLSPPSSSATASPSTPPSSSTSSSPLANTTLIPTVKVQVYAADYGCLSAALVLMSLALLLVVPLFHRFWTLGGGGDRGPASAAAAACSTMTLSPVAMARAFGAPVLFADEDGEEDDGGDGQEEAGEKGDIPRSSTAARRRREDGSERRRLRYGVVVQQVGDDGLTYRRMLRFGAEGEVGRPVAGGWYE